MSEQKRAAGRHVLLLPAWLVEHCNLTFKFCLCCGVTENVKAVGGGDQWTTVPLIKTTAREM